MLIYKDGREEKTATQRASRRKDDTGKIILKILHRTGSCISDDERDLYECSGVTLATTDR